MNGHCDECEEKRPAKSLLRHPTQHAESCEDRDAPQSDRDPCLPFDPPEFGLAVGKPQAKRKQTPRCLADQYSEAVLPQFHLGSHELCCGTHNYEHS